MDEKRGRFITIFPDYGDLHFHKDPGQIPFRFSRLGYDASIVTLSDETSLTETRKHLDVIKLRNTFFCRKFNSGILWFLIRKGSKIDFLNLFHLTWQSMLFAYVYKRLNRKGFVYLKMDSSRYSGVYEWEKIFEEKALSQPEEESKSSLKRTIKNRLIRKYFVDKVDLWSVEDDYTNRDYQSRFGFMKGKMVTVFNGHTADIIQAESVNAFNSKEDIILTVGRLGTYQKGTELLLEAFRVIACRIGFELHLAGPSGPEFESEFRQYLEKNPGLRGRVIMHGNLDKKELFTLYNRSKILCMPSRFEGMAVVFPEAMYFRNAILTTPNVSPAGIIRDHGLGIVTEAAEPAQLAEGLMSMINDREMLKSFADNAHDFAAKEFSWDNIAGNLEAEIKIRRSS